MSSSTSLPLPPPSPTADTSIPSTTNDDGDNDIGPVTKLAQKAAIEEQQRRQKQAKIDAENLRQMAAVVGSTANALSIATKTGSPVRLSPKQKYSVEINKGSSPKLSVAARARMMADVPSMPLRRAGQQQQQNSIPQLQQQPQLTSNNSSNDNTNTKSSINRRSGTNVSKAKQLLEEYGYEDNYTTSNENTTDEEEEDYYYDVPREDLFHTPRTPTNNNNQQQGQKFKSPLERSALQYTMSKSPDPYGVTTNSQGHDTNEFHYQHHKVSSYNNSKQQQQTNDNNYTDMYGLDPDEIPEIQPSTSSQSQSSGGLFATAKGWLQSQRNKLHQLELQRQVEDQRRKLVEEGRKQRLIEAERRRNFYRDGNNNMNWNSPSRVKQKKKMGQGQSTTTTPERLRQQGMINGVSSSVQHQGGSNIGTSSSFGCIDNSVLSNISNRESFNEQRSSLHPTSTSSLPPQDEEESIEDDKPSAVITGMPGICDFGGVYTTNDQYDTVEDYAGVPRVDSRGNVLEMIPSGSMDAADATDDPLDSTEIDGIEDGEGNIGIGIGYGKDGKDMKVCMKISSPKPSVSGAGMSVNVDIPIPFDTRNDYGVHGGGGRRYNAEEQVHQHERPQEQGEIEEEVDEDDPYFNSDIKIVPEPPQDDSLSSSPILQLSQMKSLISSGGLPPSLNFCKWKRLYSLTRDGDSFDQFLRMVEGHDRTVLVVKTTRNELFGGYADTRWEGRHRRQQAHDFYGSAQACLFKFPNYIGGGEVESLNQQRGVNKIIIYKWSGANRYIQLCDVAKRTVAFGGGGDEGDFGLCIEDDFRRGTTGHCSTFENDPLCDEGFFDVMDLEVWGFTLDF